MRLLSFQMASSKYVPLKRLDTKTIPTDFRGSVLKDLVKDLVHEGFEPYCTSVGGNGLGILSPYEYYSPAPRRSIHAPGQMTPPEIPSENVQRIRDEDMPDTLRTPFESKTVSELGAWAEARGRWLYV